MRLKDMYEAAFRAGMAADPRGEEGVGQGTGAGAYGVSTSYPRPGAGSSTRSAS